MATPTALDAQKRQFNGLYAAFVEKLYVNHRYIPTKEKYDKMLTALTSATVNSKDKNNYRYIKDSVCVKVGERDVIFAKKH